MSFARALPRLILILVICQPRALNAQKQEGGLARMKSWDKNKNGRLEESEIPPAMHAKFQAFAEKKGLRLEKGIPIETLFSKAGKDKASEKLKKAEQKLQRKAVSEEKSSTSKTVERSNDQAAKPRVRGFGVAPPSTRPNEVIKQAADAPAKESREQRRVKVLARSMMAQHDANKNGRLEKKEWTKLRGNPGAADKNRDGVLSMDELASHLVSYGKREKDPTAPRKANRKTKSTKKSTAKTYRFLSPHERLPKGLPAWFTEKDRNGDGQLTFREFTTRLSQSKLDEFNALDLNRDGLLVPKEYLVATE